MVRRLTPGIIHSPPCVLAKWLRRNGSRSGGATYCTHLVMKNETERCWLAAYTRSLHESHVVEQLSVKGVESLLPTYEKFSRWSDRVRRSKAPLFPGYVFVHVSNEERVPVLQTMGVVNLVSVAGNPARLGEEEIEKMRACGEHASMVEPHPFLRIGHRVRVKHGPFARLGGHTGGKAEWRPPGDHRRTDHEVRRHQPPRRGC